MASVAHAVMDILAAAPTPSPSGGPGGSWNPPVDPNAPGGGAFSQIVGALKFYGLLLSLAGVVISAIVFGIGRFIANQYAAVGGRLGFFACLGTAIVVGGGGQMVQWAYGLGQGF